jgi:hypothetical protein
MRTERVGRLYMHLSLRNAALLAALLILLSFGGGGDVRAGADLNEVGALLVYPIIVGVEGQETFVTVTNAGTWPVVAHVSYVNGDPTPISEGGAGYCYECDFELPLSGNDTETLVVTNSGGGISIESEDSTLSFSCPYPYGMIVITLEDGNGNVLTDNLLLGEEVVVDYVNGYAYSIPALSFQGKNGGDGDYVLEFDDTEYAKMPRIVASNFLAPTEDAPGTTADLAVFTLGFERQYPPLTDCSVTGYDADENPFSSSFQFGCWTTKALCDISPEFCYPNLGLFGNYDTHGWLMLNCRVDQDGDGTFEIDGGVHGALVQTAEVGAELRPNDSVPPSFSTPAAWARLLHQSVTTGDGVTLRLGTQGGGLN